MRSIYRVILGALLLAIIGFTAQLGFAENRTFTNEKTPEPTRLLFKNVKIFDGQSEQLSESSNVLIEDNKISKISTDPIATKQIADTTIINGQGHILMPGLIDNHVHILMSASTLGQLNEDEFKDIYSRGKEEAKRILLRGFTTVRDLGGPVFTLKREIDLGKQQTPGPRIYPSGAMISQTSGHGDFRAPNEPSRRFTGELSRSEKFGVNFIADGRDEVLTATRENLRFGASQIKMMAGGGASSLYDPLDTVQYTLDELKAGVEAASDWGTYVTVHAYNSTSIRRAVEAGVKVIEHGHLMNEDTMQLLADKGIWLCTQVFGGQPKAGFTPEQNEKRVVIGKGTENVFKWAKKYNVNLAWGTDLLFEPDKTDNQIKQIQDLNKYLTRFEVLKMITHDNAQLLKLSGLRSPYREGDLGVVEEGAYADLLLVKGNPLEDLSVLVDYKNNIKVIVKDGKIYKDTLSDQEI